MSRVDESSLWSVEVVRKVLVKIACFERSIYILLSNENKHNGSLIRYKYRKNTTRSIASRTLANAIRSTIRENESTVAAAPTLSVNLKLIYREKMPQRHLP